MQAQLQNLEDKITEIDEIESLGQKLADKVANFGGSWTFIISFGLFITIWIMINSIFLLSKAFDPYPFILLNLILSCIAAMQAPVIMMSQNRLEEKDRLRAKNDYLINIKSEEEVRGLIKKMDDFIIENHEKIVKTHQQQVELLNTILKKIETKNG